MKGEWNNFSKMKEEGVFQEIKKNFIKR